MEDFDEAEEMNEEDLLELGDSFGNINLKVRIIIQFKCVQSHVLETLNEFMRADKQGSDYITYCVKQLNHDDQELAKKYLTSHTPTTKLQ